jgi:RHS repeat-associated protein
MTEKNDTNYVYDSENHLLRVEHDGCVLEENVYDAGGNRVLRKTNPGGKDAQVTVLIEGIFEMNGSDAYRHVTDGHMLVASVRSAASSVHLVSSVDPTAFALLTAPSAREGVSHFGGTPLRSSVPFVGLALFGVALAGSRSARARRLWREARGVGRGVASQARRRPARWLVALFLVPTYLTYAGNVRADLAVATASAVAPLEYFFYHVDHVGNVEAISNHNGQVVQRLQYKPFGEQFSDHIAPTHSGFLDASDPHAKALDRSFNGHEFDAASSLYYFGARHYNPILGRFLSADTKVFEGENPQLLHRYAFNVNNPIRYADLTGHGFWDVVLGIVVAVLIIAAVVVVSIGTAGVGDIVFGVAVGVLIGAGVGLAVGAVLAYAKYGNLTSAASLRLILATTFAGELVGASVGFIVGAGGLGAAFSAQNIADWAGHDLIANLLIGAAGGAIGAEAGADPNNPDYGLEIFLGTAIGAGVGAIAGASDGLGNIWEPINFPGWEAGLFSLYGGATGSFLTVNGYICKQTGVACFQDPGITPSTDISSSSSQLTVERRRGVPAWSFDGTSLGSGTVSFINREHLDLYPLAP